MTGRSAYAIEIQKQVDASAAEAAAARAEVLKNRALLATIPKRATKVERKAAKRAARGW